MTAGKKKRGVGIPELTARNRELESRVRELEETLDAIRSGEVDAIVVSRDDAQKVYTLEGPDQPYRALVESFREGALTLSSEGIILYANARFASMVQTPIERIIGTPLLDYICPDDLSTFREAFRSLQGSPCRGRLRFRAVSGTLPVVISMNPLFSEPGSKISVIVTDWKEEEEELRESEGRFRTLNETSPIGVGVSSADGVLLYTNPSYESILGYQRGELPGKRVRDLYLNPDDRTSWLGALKEGRSVRNVEIRLKRKDGTPVWVSINASHITYGGKPAVMGTIQDITDRRQAEQALREAKQGLEIRVKERTAELEGAKAAVEAERQRLYGVLNTMPAYVILLSQDYHVPFANRFFTERFGESRGRRCYEYLFHRSEPCDNCESFRVARTGQPHHWEWLGPDGRTYDIHDFPFIDTDGSRLIMEVGIDITEQKRAHRELVEHRDHLETLVRERSRDLAESEQRLRALYGTMTEGLANHEMVYEGGKAVDYVITDVNPAFEKILSLPRADVIGRRASEVYGTGIPPYLDRYASVASGGDPIKFETFFAPMGRYFAVSAFSPGKGRFATVFSDITDRKHAEEAIRESEERFRALYKGLPISAVVFQREGGDFTIRDYNQAAQEFTQERMEEFLGRKAGELYAALPAILEQFALVWETKVPRTYRSRYRKISTGQDIFLTMTLAFIPPDRILVLSEDNTELKDSEETLRETSQYLENLINFANAPIIVWDPGFRITRFNHAFERLTGRTAGEVVGQDLGILFPKGSKQESMDHIRRTMAGEHWEAVEIPILHRGGEVSTVLWNSATLYEADGKTVSSAIAQGQDITERKRAEEEVALKAAEIAAANIALREEIAQRVQAGEALERTMALLKATFESTADGILSIDADGVVAGFNQNFVAMWNVPFALLQSPDMEAFLRHMAAQLVDPGEFLSTNAELLAHPGRVSYDMLELADGRIFERDSRPQRIGHDIVGRIWSYRDITERKRNEEKVLASLNEKEVLLREIHHRVKNNLQLISGLLDLTRLRTQDPETLGILTDMMLKIQTMAQIHTRLYESKQFDRINMGTQIRDQITSLSQIYGQKGREISCETELPDLYLPIDQAIPCALAVNEILSNAFKHAFKGRAHGSLRVRASREDSRVRITVRDDGRGIPPDLDIARSRSLGLKLIRNLVENQLKGSLAIHRDGGTEVIVEFPISSQEGEHVTDTGSGR